VHVVTLGDSGGERDLEAGSCDALADAVAVVLALRVQPSLLLEPPPSIPPAAPPAPGPPVPSTQNEALPPPAVEAAPPPSEPLPGTMPPGDSQPPRHPVSVYIGASALGELGSLPSLEPGGELQAGVGLGRLRLEGLAASGPKQTAVAPVGSASIGVLRGGLRPCYGLALGRWTFAGCGVAEVDWMWADGVPGPGIATARSQSASWVGLGAGVQGRWALSRRFALRMSLEGIIPTQRRRFVTEASSSGQVVDDVHDPSVVWGRAELGVEATIF
jgi:hypothetical protein